MKQQYPEEHAELVWQYKGMTLSIVKQTIGHYCGYVHLDHKTTLTETDLWDVEVHGGITYGGADSEVLGFDCNHWKDADDPKKQDINWMKAETERMTDDILEREAYIVSHR